METASSAFTCRCLFAHMCTLDLTFPDLTFPYDSSTGGTPGHMAGRSNRQGAAAGGGGATEELRRQLTVLITSWMTKPHVDDDAAVQLLQVLTDEMIGF